MDQPDEDSAGKIFLGGGKGRIDLFCGTRYGGLDASSCLVVCDCHPSPAPPLPGGQQGMGQQWQSTSTMRRFPLALANGRCKVAQHDLDQAILDVDLYITSGFHDYAAQFRLSHGGDQDLVI